jgi:geranylgeranyl diphosphate synthase type II
MDAVQSEIGDKPVGQDALLHRPNAVAERGVQGALAKLNALVEQAVASVPDCEGAKEMRDLVRMTAMRLAPKQLSRSAA